MRNVSVDPKRVGLIAKNAKKSTENIQLNNEHSYIEPQKSLSSGKPKVGLTCT